jgi:predicted RNA-binding protein with PUA-like domain
MKYWLMKSEPDVFGFNDLLNATNKITPWEGVRNYQARNYMRDDMRKGDKVLFYHSSTKIPGVAGLAQVASSAYPDPTQFNAGGDYFDPKSTPENPRWMMVNVQAIASLELVTLETMRQDPKLDSMMLLQRGSRLSIQPVIAVHFKHILKLGGWNERH